MLYGERDGAKAIPSTPPRNPNTSSTEEVLARKTDEMLEQSRLGNIVGGALGP